MKGLAGKLRRLLDLPVVITAVACTYLGYELVIRPECETIALANTAFLAGAGLSALAFTVAGACQGDRLFEVRRSFIVAGAQLGSGSCLFLMSSVLKTTHCYIRASTWWHTANPTDQAIVNYLMGALTTIPFGIGVPLALVGFRGLTAGLIDHFLDNERPPAI